MRLNSPVLVVKMSYTNTYTINYANRTRTHNTERVHLLFLWNSKRREKKCRILRIRGNSVSFSDTWAKCLWDKGLRDYRHGFHVGSVLLWDYGVSGGQLQATLPTETHDNMADNTDSLAEHRVT